MSHNYLGTLFLCISLAAFSAPTSAQIYVDIDAAAGGDGSSWANAYRSLVTAMTQASTGDQIWVAEGTYHPTDGIDQSIYFDIPEGVKIYAGFTGIETTLNQRDYTANETILSGDIGTQNFSTDNSNTVVYFGSVSAATLLDGFIIEDGYANGGTQIESSGPAIYVNAFTSASRPMIHNCTIRNNYANNSGGAVYIDGSFSGAARPSFVNCKFDSNTSQVSGGAVYTNGIIGGLANPTFLHCDFTNNTTFQSGGAFFNNGDGGNCNPEFYQCNFDSNKTLNEHGGAMYNVSKKNTDTNVVGYCNPLIYNCRFYKNSAYAAGAIYNNGGSEGNTSPSIINSTFVGNFTFGGGGTGGAIYNNGDNNGNCSTLISNCIIWDNTAPWGSHVLRNINATPTIRYTLVDVADCTALNNGAASTVTCESGMIYNQDPMFMDAANGDLHLDEGSPAQDVGTNADNSTSFDLDRGTRIIEGNIDLGAYERTSSILPIELLEFTAVAVRDEVQLQWITLSEQNNDYFVIERSTDGRNFTAIGELVGAGDSDEILKYEMVDDQPVTGTNYYRLRQVDFDGKFSLSEVEVINFGAADEAIIVYPNPVRDVLQIANSQLKDSAVTYDIFNLQGQQISGDQMQLAGGRGQIDIAALQLQAGYYMIRIQTAGGESYSHKFQKL